MTLLRMKHAYLGVLFCGSAVCLFWMLVNGRANQEDTFMSLPERATSLPTKPRLKDEIVSHQEIPKPKSKDGIVSHQEIPKPKTKNGGNISANQNGSLPKLQTSLEKPATTEQPPKGPSVKTATYPAWFSKAWYKSPSTRSSAYAGDRPLYEPACRRFGKARGLPYIEPKLYIPENKNPCWFEESRKQSKLYCVPYFYIAGVAKCGTTDLYRRIRLHPDIMRGTLKEYHFWNRERYGNVETTEDGKIIKVFRKPWTFDYYIDLIMGEKDRRIVESEIRMYGHSDKVFGDGSPAYLWDILKWQEMAQNEGCDEPRIIVGQHIYRIYPKAKMILIFRHPTPRLYSRFLSRLWRTSYLSGSTSATFHEYVVTGVKLYKDCFKKYSLRQCAYNYTIFDNAVIRLIEGMYPIFMADWLRIWPREQMLLLRSEDYAEDLNGTMKQVFDFLGVRELPQEEFDRIAEQAHANVGKEYDKLGPMLPETVKILDEFYQPFVDKFAEILNDPRFLWKDTYPPKTE